jgi:hypothetical protein
MNLNRTHTVSPNCSRKSFFAKLGGMLVGMGVVPSLLAKVGAPAARPETAVPVTVRSEQRAVSRKEGSY